MACVLTALLIAGASWAATLIPVSQGGTGASTASGARSNLGLGTIATQNVGTLTNTKYCTYATGTGFVCNSDGIGSMTYPDAGIAVSTGSAWDTSITDNSSNWNTAYGWGNHASAGYLTAETDPSVDSAAEILAIIDNEALDFGTGVITAAGFVGALTGNSSTATALASNPSDCGANQFANAIASNGNLTCAGLADADIPDDITIANAGAVEGTDLGTLTDGKICVYDLAGTEIDCNYTDVDTTLSEENVEDYVGGMLSGNTETHISVDYQDDDGTIDFVVSDDWYNSLADLQGAVTNDFHNLGGTDANTTYTAGDFLTLTGTDFDVDTAAVTNGDTTHLSTADAIYDFVIGLGYEGDTHASEHAVGAADTIFPADPGADKCLQWNDDPGTLAWVDCAASGATTALDNLASVAINTSLISDTDSTNDLGSSAKYWANAYLDKIYLDADSTIEAADIDGWNALVSESTSVDDTTTLNLTLTGTQITGDVITLKDIVAGTGLSGGADNVLPGADSDVTLAVDTTEIDGNRTWGAADGNTITWTYNLVANDPSITFGPAMIVANDDLHIGGDDATENLVIHDAGYITMYDASDDTSVQIGPVGNGGTTLAVTGTINASGLQVGGNAVLTAESDPKVGTLTNTKWCTTDGSTINCTEDAPASSGDVTDVGDCAGGACLDGTSDGGTYIKFYDAQGAGQLVTGDLTEARTWTLPDSTGTLVVGTPWTGEGYLTANQSITLSGDVSGSGQTSITTTIGNDKILEAHLKAVNAASDEECLTYESTTGDFEWQSCSTGIAAADIDTSAELLAILTDETGTGLLVFNNSPTFSDDITIHATGVKLTGDGDGALTILGLGDGYDEDLTLNLDDTENTLVLSSSTGLATIDIGTMALEIDEGKLTDSTIVSADIKDGTITAADTAITAGRSLTWSTNDMKADAELYTDTKCIYFEDPTADDDFKSIWFAKQAATLTSIWCESDQTVNLDLQVDDGSPADVNGTDLVCDTTPPEDTSLAGDATMASGDRLDLAITSVSGTPTWVSVCWTFEYSD